MKKKPLALRRLTREFLPYKKMIAISLFFGLVVSAVQPICVKLIEGIVNQLQAGVGDNFFRQTPLLLIGVFVISGVAKFLYNTTRRYVAENVVLKLRADLFGKYLSSPISQIHRNRVGEMLSGIQNDLQQIHAGLDTIYDLAKEPFTFLGLMGVAFYCDWQLGLSTVVVAPLVAYAFSRSGAAVKRYSSKNLQHFSDIISLSEESLVGSGVVKAFNLEETLLQKFRRLQKEYFQILWKSIKVQELATPTVELIGATLMAGVLVYGGYRISLGPEVLTSGALIAFVVAIGLAQMPLKKLNNAYLRMKNAEAAAERVYRMLDVPEYAFIGNHKPDGFHESLVFDRVGLAYGEKRALHDISFEVKKGQTVAFVGNSGSGKSSIVNLLSRLHDPTEGWISIDGTDIQKFDLPSLRQLCSYVSQETFLFNDTIFENIRYGKPTATDEEVRQAAALAHCNEFLERFPEGVQTKVGDRGTLLSGGERQRVAIARALLRGSPILVLDEATSNLDSHSEAVVQDAMETLMKGRTSLIVAHRLSTIKHADQIFVVEAGRIRERGEHNELVRAQGIYSKFVERQSLSLL